MRFLKFSLLCVFALIYAGCAFQKPMTGKTTVRKIEPGIVLDNYELYYGLPRTVLDISVMTEKKVTSPGPFAAYAERFLGIPDVPLTESVVYSIAGITVSSHPEKDPEQVYLVQSSGHPFGSGLSLTADGIIRGINIPVNTDLTISQVTVADLRERIFDNPEYPDLTLRKNFEPVPDTIFRVVRTDTSFYRLPIIQKVESQKTVLAQAEEAANVLVKIRTSRFNLLNGDIFNELDSPVSFPEGTAMEVILRELLLLEQDYMSLFTGRMQTEREILHYSYTPAGQSLTETSILFNFSRLTGIDSNGEPVILQLSRSEANPVDEVQFAPESSKSPKEKGLAYRIPELVRVEINRTGQNLFTRNMLVAQCGRIDFLPIQVLMDESTAVEYYPAYGSIKNIFRR